MATTSPVSLSLSYRAENKRFSTLKRTKTGGIQPKLNVAYFVQSCFAVADFVVFSNYCLIGTRRKRCSFSAARKLSPLSNSNSCASAPHRRSCRARRVFSCARSVSRSSTIAILMPNWLLPESFYLDYSTTFRLRHGGKTRFRGGIGAFVPKALKNMNRSVY